MAVEIDKLRADIRHDMRRTLWQGIAAIGTAFAGGAAAVTIILHLMGKL